MKAVIDTNVLISGLINLHSPPGRIIDTVRSGRLVLVVDDRILGEYRDVLFRERMCRWITMEDARNIMSFMVENTEYVVSSVRILGLPDEGDAPFIEAAITAAVPLVTGNHKHFPESLCRGHPVLSPSDFLNTNPCD